MRSYLIVFFLALFSLTACTATPHPEGKPVAQQTFSHFQAVPLEVDHVDIEQLYNPDEKQGDISQQLLLPPNYAVMNYARNRFKAAGGIDRFRFVLEDASVTKKLLKPENQTLRWLGMGAEEEYRFKIVVNVQCVPPGSFSGPGATVTLDRTMILPENTSIAKREQRQNDFVEKLVRDLDARLLEIAQHTMRLY